MSPPVTCTMSAHRRSQPSFTPMTAPPAHTTLPPDPSHPITNLPGSSQTHSNGSPSGQSSPSRSGQGGSTSSKAGKPLSTSTGGGGGGAGGKGGPGKGGPGNNGDPIHGSGTNKTAIALGTVFGVLRFTTGVAFVLWYLHQRHACSGHAFDPLSDDEEESPHSITAVRLGGMCKMSLRILAVPLGLLGMIGLGPAPTFAPHVLTYVSSSTWGFILDYLVSLFFHSEFPYFCRYSIIAVDTPA